MLSISDETQTEIHNIWSRRKRKIESDFNMFSRSKIISFQNIMTLPKYLSYWEDNCFSFFLKSVLLQFKFIPAEFKNSLLVLGVNVLLGAKNQPLTDRLKRISVNYVFYVFMFAYMSPLRIPHMPPASSLKVLYAPAHRGGIRRASQTKIYNFETDEFVSNPPFSKI